MRFSYSPLKRLRSGYTTLRKAYAHLLDPVADPTCPLCMEDPQAVENWQQRRPNLYVLRQPTFGSPASTFGVLTAHPAPYDHLLEPSALASVTMSTVGSAVDAQRCDEASLWWYDTCLPYEVPAF